MPIKVKDFDDILKKDYNKNYQIEFMLDEINLEDLISQLLVAKVDIKDE